IRYRYDSDGRVTEQLNPAGLSYTYQYEKDHITITDSLPAVEWLTYGSGYLAGMKLGDTPLVEYTRDRLHRE
ncbi:hypothetical protein ACLEVE_24920, partial [Escherichia coli]